MAVHHSLTRAGSFLLPFLALAAACSHEAPFQNRASGLDSTLTGGTDRQLTFNLAADLTPAWLADGSGLIYSVELLSDSLHDRCLAVLPPGGGTRRDLPCGTTAASRDTVDNFANPAAGPDGRLLFTREWSTPFNLAPIRGGLELAPLGSPDSASILLTYPYTAPNGNLHQGISHIRWLSASRAIYQADRVSYPRGCGTCPADTVRTGIELVLLDLAGGTASIQPIPGTDSASSVDAGATGDDVFFTRLGDTRIYQLTLSSGAVTVVHDFGAGGIARDVAYSGDHLYAIVGGHVVYTVDPVLGPSQLDFGGTLYSVDLVNNTDAGRIVDNRLFKAPVASPDRRRVVAESFPITINYCGATCRDTVYSKSSDLWLLDVP